MPKKVKAARLTLGGAPESWHTVVGLPGHFHPVHATPLDQPGLPTLEQVHAFLAAFKADVKNASQEWERFRAERLDAGHADIGPFQTPAAPVELVDVDADQVDELAAQARQQTALGARAAAAARRAGEAATPHVQAQTAAVGGEQ